MREERGGGGGGNENIHIGALKCKTLGTCGLASDGIVNCNSIVHPQLQCTCIDNYEADSATPHYFRVHRRHVNGP